VGVRLNADHAAQFCSDPLATIVLLYLFPREVISPYVTDVVHATIIENQYPQVIIPLTAYTRSAISQPHLIAVEEL
jgi:hypothetical protein